MMDSRYSEEFLTDESVRMYHLYIQFIRIFGSTNTPQTTSQFPECCLELSVGWVYIGEA